MELHILETRKQIGEAAANAVASALRQAIAARGEANLILATGTSQFEMLERLVKLEVNWAAVTVFHLDEYIGLPKDHPAGFRKYLKERFADHVPALKAFHYIDGGAADPQAECCRLETLISAHPIDVACVGVGENGHLAFNDPPADFITEEPYIIVYLDEKCRRQQLGEGWFPTLESVPQQAISMSIRQIMKSACIVCIVPDQRKAVPVRDALEGPISAMCPASILRDHPRCQMFLDRAAASFLKAGGQE